MSGNASHIANINPFRYRGYYYDTETGFYYLQSRYYDPVVGRFLNADTFVSTGQGIIGNNMFAYCNNCPVMYVDPTGYIRTCSVNVTDSGRTDRYRTAIMGEKDVLKEYYSYESSPPYPIGQKDTCVFITKGVYTRTELDVYIDHQTNDLWSCLFKVGLPYIINEILPGFVSNILSNEGNKTTVTADVYECFYVTTIYTETNQVTGAERRYVNFRIYLIASKSNGEQYLYLEESTWKEAP